MLVAAIANSAGVSGRRVISLRLTSREIPGFFILAINVILLAASFFCGFRQTKWIWRKRVGVEPTTPPR
jgi:hypothetical protein